MTLYEQSLESPNLDIKHSILDANPPSHRRPSGLEISDAPAVAPLPTWKDSKISILRTFASFFSFVVLGMNDAVTGAVIPYLETDYSLTFTVVSLVFLSPVAGYAASGFTNNWIHLRFGQRGIAIIASICHIISYAIVAAHPPYPVLVVAFIFAGYGNGLVDAAWYETLAFKSRAQSFAVGTHGLVQCRTPMSSSDYCMDATELEQRSLLS